MQMFQAVYVYKVLIECVLNLYYALSFSLINTVSNCLFPFSLGIIYNRKCIIQVSKSLYMYLLESRYIHLLQIFNGVSFCSNLFVNFKHFIHLLSCFSTLTGTRIGTVIGLPLAGVLCASDLWGGWPSVFYIYGMYIYTPVCI